MDFFAHIMWSIIVYGKFVSSSAMIQIAVFSVVPDLMWGIPVFSHVLASRNRKIHITHERKEYADKFGKIYNTSHSLIMMLVAFAIFSLLTASFYYPVLLGWALHVVIDLFVHKESYFPQKPFYPLSHFRVRGYFLHLNKKFVIINWIIIITLMMILYLLPEFLLPI